MYSKFRYTILMQGGVSKWTSEIVNEYLIRFPDARILLSTWTTENVDKINCEIIQLEQPEITKPHKSTVNHQIIGASEGLKKIDEGIIMKCRTDQFIHNSKIFEIYENECPKEKIMIPNQGTYETLDYRVSDFCQIGTKKILEDYWSNIPLHNGKLQIESGQYMTKNYILKIRNDDGPWKLVLRKYFLVKDVHDVFQMEWEKLNEFEDYQGVYKRNFPVSAKND